MYWWFLIPAALVGIAIGYFYRKNVAEAKIAKAEDAVRTMLDDAQKKAEEIRKEKELEAKEEIYKLRTEAEKENRDRRNELQRTERRLFQREESLDKKIEAVEAREQALNQRITKVEQREAFRQVSFIRAACVATVTGKGFDGYLEAIDILLEQKA